MQYENGFLRWISAGEDEVLRMIYFAVRDKNWGTVPGKIINEKIERHANTFSIAYEMLFEQDNINMHWHATIQGNADNSIVFEIQGKALTTFQKNRTGFCVLHPIKECAGKKVLIQHTDGSIEENFFPVYISPYQPFKNIAGMQWQIHEHCKVSVQFEGDIFETEDHRNWTDNNFKTYCTPLELPFPATMHEGDEVHQKITVRVEGDFVQKKSADAIDVFIEEEKLPLPKIGVGRSSERNENYHEALKALSVIGFNHYRADIKLNDDDWLQTLQECFTEADLLKTKLEIALFTYKGCNEKLMEFIEEIKHRKDIQQIILLEENAKCIRNDLLKEIIALVRPQLFGILVGAGTDAWFTELNRSNLDASDIDFVSYSVNPQVHAFDDASVMENAAAQGETVISAKHKFNKPVHVSPVTLKMRYNPDAADKNNISFLPPADARQQTIFCAAWTLASIVSLTKAGASSVTYFEAAGERGFIKDDGSLKTFPALEILRRIPGKKFTHARKCAVSNALACTAIVLVNNEEEFLIVSNLESYEIAIQIHHPQKKNYAARLVAFGLLEIKL